MLISNLVYPKNEPSPWWTLPTQGLLYLYIIDSLFKLGNKMSDLDATKKKARTNFVNNVSDRFSLLGPWLRINLGPFQ